MNDELDTFEHLIAHIVKGMDQNIQKKTPNGARMCGLKLEVRYSNYVSNSQHCPHNGVTNWCNMDETKPDCYPGWVGRIWYRVTAPIRCFSNELLQNSGVYTNAGGFGSYQGPFRNLSVAHHDFRCVLRQQLNVGKITKKYHSELLKKFPEPQIYSFDCMMFAADWPELAKDQAIRVCQETLSRTRINPLHVVQWEDPEIVELDRRCLIEAKQYIQSHNNQQRKDNEHV
jgi:hypothetical protein